jgi:secretion/DNA translocation related CpaE-like protein
MDTAEPLPSPPGPAPTAAASTRPLVVAQDPAALDALVRLSAAAGVAPDVAPDLPGARPLWSSAPLVVVAGAGAAAVAAQGPPRRAGVLVVVTAPAPADVWRHAVTIGAEQVLVLPDDESAVISRLADTADGGTRSGVVAAVVGGCGGAGASTFAAALGVAAGGLGASCLLLDADPLGGGLDLVLGSEDVPGVRWPDLVGTSGRVAAASLRDALPQVGALSVLSWDRGDVPKVAPEVVRAVLTAGRRGHDLVVVDLPRRVDAVAEDVLLAADTALLVVPAEVRAVAAAARVAARLTALTARVEVVVRGPGPSGLDATLVGEALGLPVAAQMRAERGIDAVLDSGEGLWRRRRGPLARACRAVLAQRLPHLGSAA